MVRKVNIDSTGSSNIITAKDLIEPMSATSNQFDKLDKYLKLADKGLEYIDRIDGLLVKLGIKKKPEQQQQCKPQVIEKEVVVEKPVEKIVTPNIDADMIIKGFEKIKELAGDMKLSELVEYINQNKEQVNNLIKQGMEMVKKNGE